MKRFTLFLFSNFTMLVFSASAQQSTDTKSTEVWEPVPKMVSPGKYDNQPPSDAVVLFTGKELNEWSTMNGEPAKWKVNDNSMIVVKGTGGVRTKKIFGDCQLHIEWKTPTAVEGEGQGRGNSGVFLMGNYEVQVLDSYNNRTYSNGQAGSIYKQHIPLVNASRPPGEWQSYDIIFKAPRFNSDGTLQSPAYFTVLQNGVLIQNHVEVKGTTTNTGLPAYKKHADKEPITLQDHGNPVEYRNVWVREL